MYLINIKKYYNQSLGKCFSSLYLLKLLYRCVLFLLALSTTGALPAVTFAAPVALSLERFNDTELSAQAYAVLDAETGDLLLAKNENQPWPPASMTKLTSALVMLETNPDLRKVVQITKADEVGGSRLRISKATSYRCLDLLYAALVASANNAANALVHCTNLSRDEFVERMNKVAADAGAWRTHFVEPTGISGENVTTSEDYARIARVAFNQPVIQKITTTPSYTFSSMSKPTFSHTLKNTNKLLKDQSVIVRGGKTGFIEESGYNLVTKLGDVDGKNVIVVVLGTKNTAAETKESKRLATWTWVNFLWDKAPGTLSFLH